MAATGAVILGTLAGLVLSRFGPFKGRAFLQGLTTAPLVMPEVITGLSMLLLFVSLEQLFQALFGWQFDRGIATITIAHITFTMAYVTVVVQSRLASFDDSLEEAALDLGARPAKVFFRITVPLILPAILSGWLLAFTLSWDDLVVTQFVSGPGSNTLPMVIFSRVRLGVSPVVNALATIMVVIVALGRDPVGVSHAPPGTTSQTRGTDGRDWLTTDKLPPSKLTRILAMAKSRKHNAPWTPADLKKMRALAKAKMSARLAAKELGRSTGAVKYKAMVEGIRFRFIDQPAGVQLKLARKAKRAKKK